jgi:hypothetical protein
VIAATATARPIPRCWRKVFRDGGHVRGRRQVAETCGALMAAVESTTGKLLAWRCPSCCYVGNVDAAGKIVDPREIEGPCCGLAKRLDCVCREAWRCREHGEKHVGRHD